MSNSSVVSFNPPANVNAGASFEVDCVLQNTGSDTWVPASSIGAASGYKLGSNPMDNNIWGQTRIALPSQVASGQNVAIPISARAPALPGIYSFNWQMVNEGVAWFGEIAHSNINVVAAPIPPIPLSSILSNRPGEVDTASLPASSAAHGPWLWDSGQYPADGQWRTAEFINDTKTPLSIVKSYLWTGIQIGGICDTHVGMTAVDLGGNQRLINVLQWDHYAAPTTFQGRFLDHPHPTILQPGELLKFTYFTAVTPGIVAQHAANIWVLRG